MQEKLLGQLWKKDMQQQLNSFNQRLIYMCRLYVLNKAYPVFDGYKLNTEKRIQ